MSLLTPQKLVIYLESKVLTVGFVRLGTRLQVHHQMESEWDNASLPEIFKEIRNSYNTDTARIVLTDSLCHVLSLQVPPKTTDVRAYLAKQVALKIPEALSEDEWDYKTTAMPHTKGNQVLVFAPKKTVYDTLLAASEASGLDIEAMEPLEMASKRNNDPLIGIALKEDLDGENEHVLNLQIEREHRKLNWAHILIGFFVLAAIIAGSSGAYLLAQKRRQNKPTPEITTPPVQKEASPSTPPVEEVKLDTLNVQILNGSGVAGKAGEAKELLVKAGFMKVDTGNATSFNFTQTTVQRKAGVSDRVIETIKKALNVTLVEEATKLANDATYDIIVILGK